MKFWNGPLFEAAGEGSGGGGGVAEVSTSTGGVSTGFDINNVDGELSTAADAEDISPEGEAEPLALETEAEGDAEPISDEFDQEIGAPQIVDGPNGEKLYQYSAPQSQALQAHARFASELQAAIPDITINDAIAHNEAYTDLLKISHDIRQGTPQAVARFVAMMAGEGGKGPFLGNLATNLVGQLRQSGSPAYDQIRGAAETDLEKEVYDLAAKVKNHPDETIRVGYKMLAKLLHFHLHDGVTKEVEEYTAVDPLAAREAKIREQEESFAKQEEQRAWVAAKAWVAAARTTTTNDLKAAVEAALAPHKARYEKQPEILRMVTSDVLAQVRERISTQDKEWTERFNLQWRDAHATGTRESLKEVTDSYIARAKSILKSQLPKMLSSASSGQLEQSRARHQQLQRASAQPHRVPGATGVPTKQSIAPKPGNFMKPDDYARFLDTM